MVGKLLETTRREGEFGVNVDGGGREVAGRSRDLSGKEELKTELGFSATALGDELGHGIAGNSAAEEAVQNGATGGALLGGEGSLEETLWFHWCVKCSFLPSLFFLWGI